MEMYTNTCKGGKMFCFLTWEKGFAQFTTASVHIPVIHMTDGDMTVSDNNLKLSKTDEFLFDYTSPKYGCY